ncbi:MAG: NAD(P)/FAD-dependent oxidoreductase [Actinomycetota bacterium]
MVRRNRDSRRVAVVGASTSGLFSATRMAREGLEVHLLERSSRLELSPRALIVTERVRRLLSDLDLHPSGHTVDSYQLVAGAVAANINLLRPDLIIERSHLIGQLADRARAAGVSIHLGRRVIGIEPAPGGMRLYTRGDGGSEEAHAAIVIGADGARSTVAQAVGADSRPTVPVLQALVHLPPQLSSRTVRVWFRPQDTRFFYWLIPDSPRTAVVGLVADGTRAPRVLLDEFLEEIGLEPMSYQAGSVPIRRSWAPLGRRVGEGHVYLVGDAAGHVKVSTVGGLVTGFEGAFAISEVVLGRPPRTQLRRLRAELWLHRMIRDILDSFDERDYVRLLGLIPGRVDRILASRSRDDVVRLTAILCAAQPRLAGFAWRRVSRRRVGNGLVLDPVADEQGGR